MEQNTKEKKSLLIWAVWIAAGLCLAITIFLVVLIWRHMARPAPRETVEEIQEVTEAVEEIQEETLPILNLEACPYTEDDFVYDGENISCTVVPTRKGIDVSYWQYDIDWQQVKEAGIEFVMIRLAWRGSTEGTLGEDSYAKINYEGAKAAGLQVGGYFFSQAITPEEAAEEAAFVLELTKDWEFDLPIVFDWEQSGDRTALMNPRLLTDCTKAFCSAIEEAGREAMVYFGFLSAHYSIYLEELDEYDFWLAMYDSKMDFPYKVDMWQYSDSGTVPGIEGPVDLNIIFDYE